MVLSEALLTQFAIAKKTAINNSGSSWILQDFSGTLKNSSRDENAGISAAPSYKRKESGGTTHIHLPYFTSYNSMRTPDESLVPN